MYHLIYVYAIITHYFKYIYLSTERLQFACCNSYTGCYVTDPGAAIKGVGDFVGDLFGAAEKFSHLG